MYSTSQKWKETIYKNVQSVLNIYIDDELINPDYILEFKVGQTLFDEELTLGSISSKYIEFKIYKDKMPENMSKVKVDYGILINHALTVAEVNAMLVGTLNGIQVKSLSANDSSFEMIPIGIFNIDDWTDNDDNTLTIKCIDNMSKFEFNYDGSKLEYPTTLLTVLQDICSKAGVELGSTSFLNSNIQVATYDNTVSAREYLSYISECAGGFAFIGRDGKLYIRTIYQDEQEIALELFGEYKWGDKYKISKVSYENGVESFKFGDDTCNNLWLNQDNMYIVEEDEVENIYNQLKGLEAYSFEGKTIIDPALDVGDKIIIDGKSVIYQGEADFQTRFIAEISSKISIKQKQETTVKTTSQKVLNRRIQSSIDEINGKITQVVQETSENSEKISKVEQTAESITQTVSNVEEKVETVETKADKAQSTADNINSNLTTNYYTKTQTNSQIDQKADEISSTVSQTYSTKEETNTAKQDAISSANANTDEKLEDYSTTEEMNSAITQKADSITSTVNDTLQDYATRTETESMIEQSADQIQTVISSSIGTTNLVPNSDFSHQNSNGVYDLSGWTKYGNLQTETENENNKVILDYDKTWLSIYKETLGTYGIGRILKPIEPDQDYTLSFKLMNDPISEGKTRSTTVQVTMYLQNTSGNVIQTLTQSFDIQDTWDNQNFNYTFHTINNEELDNIDLRINGISLLDDNGGNTVFASSITDIQIELGKTATDWRPSQTDFYETVQQYSKLVQTVDSLESTVAYQDDLEEAKSNFKQTTDRISTEVSKKVGNDEIISKINQSAEQVQINANKISLERKKNKSNRR